MKKIFKIILGLGILLPSITFAAKDLNYLIGKVADYFNVAIQLIIAFAIMMFVYNVYKYFIKGSDDVGAKKEAGLYVLWSVVGFFVILSIWGLVNILLNTFDLDDRGPTRGFFPSFKFSGSSESRLPNNGIPNSGGTNSGAPNSGGINTGAPNSGVTNPSDPFYNTGSDRGLNTSPEQI
jgi:hypothetical protein